MVAFVSGQSWAEQTFGAVELGDVRRTQRVVQLAAAMEERPAGSLPQQVQSGAALQAAYHLLHSQAVTHAALLQPHRDQTRQAACGERVVLIIHDTTEIDYTHHPQTEGLGPIGDGRGRGYLLQSALAVSPTPRRVLGVLHQEPKLRVPAPKRETVRQRQARERESERWTRAVAGVGAPPAGSQWVHVGDRYSDMFEFLTACRHQRGDFLIRAYRDRRVETSDGTIESFLTVAHRVTEHDRREVRLPRSRGRPARTAQVRIGVEALTIQVPQQDRTGEPLPAWLIRVWEEEPPEGIEPIDWILLTSVETTTVEQAWERVAWYTVRWVIEEYHQCLKTGCALEGRNLQDKEALWRLLGLCAPLAVQLLQLRDLASDQPEQLAAAVLPPDQVQVVALLSGEEAARLTVGGFWRAVAQRGGYLGRTGDGPPGWKSLWRGWQELSLLLQGVQLAAHLPLQRSD